MATAAKKPTRRRRKPKGPTPPKVCYFCKKPYTGRYDYHAKRAGHGS